jgi:hypothetical protein
MAKKRMLADVLWEAATQHLSEGPYETRKGCVWHSCNALRWASKHSVSPRFLHTLGAPHGAGDFPDGVDTQGCRFMFLLFAMHVAEDEGITV